MKTKENLNNRDFKFLWLGLFVLQRYKIDYVALHTQGFNFDSQNPSVTPGQEILWRGRILPHT